MSAAARETAKVPAITLGFWVIKIAATTLGETGGDALSMTLKLGYLLSSVIFLGLFAIAVATQVAARRFHPLLYWAVIVATTTAGTTIADFCDRSLGVGYPGGTAILLALLIAVLALWRWRIGRISADHIAAPQVEIFYWAAILASNTLGTALGDFAADSGLGYEGGALLFAAGLALVLLAHVTGRVSQVLLFWLAFILTRPLCATVGDLLTKPHAKGGLALGTLASSALLAAFVLLAILLTWPRNGRTPRHA